MSTKRSKGNEIYLEDFRTKIFDEKSKTEKVSKIFTGRDRGAAVRKESKIDKLIEKYESLKFYIPNNIYSINPSFFEELFSNVVSNLGVEKFFNKIEFINEGDYDYEENLKEAVDRIVRTESALG